LIYECLHDTYLLQQRLNVSLPGLNRDVAQRPAYAVHKIYRYSKSIRSAATSTSRLIQSEQKPPVNSQRANSEPAPAEGTARRESMPCVSAGKTKPAYRCRFTPRNL
jgi:hypothetical protein